MRKAEMELKKGQNMIEHEAEIYSRPARTWFQNTKDKQKAEGLFRFKDPLVERDCLHSSKLLELSKEQYINGGKSKPKTVAVDDTKVIILLMSSNFR